MKHLFTILFVCALGILSPAVNEDLWGFATICFIVAWGVLLYALFNPEASSEDIKDGVSKKGSS